MAKCHRNDIGSLLLNHATSNNASAATSNSGFNICKSLSATALRRKLLCLISCGGSSSHSRRQRCDSNSDKIPENAQECKQLTECDEARSENLCDLLNLAEIREKRDGEAEARQKADALEKLKRVVTELQCGDCGDGGDKSKNAARDVRSIAKENAEARAMLAMLGAIPPLVGMLDSEDVDSQIAALYALLNLGIGNDVNKAAIVKAGAVHKMLKLIEPSSETMNPSISGAIAANFLGLSALDSNKAIIGSSGAIPFLVNTLLNLDNRSSLQATQDALRALYNLSISPLNVTYMLETNLVPFFMNALGDMEVSERILSILSNIVSTPEGRKSIGAVHEAFTILVDVLSWNDSPACQEKASYILMVMAHKGYGHRQAMIEAGIVSALLELTLIGSTLAQKRASRILECLRVDKGKQVSESYCSSMGSIVSAPICGSSSASMAGASRRETVGEEDDMMMSEEKKAVQQLVKLSLQNNMRRIVKRANLPQDFVPSDHLKCLTTTSTSKSLPF
ncbi:hypothetical protein SAY86_003155 [Trapa natans]|uniref:U-box domain-containing protein n=1 Tax=Trapa natans TaxID=22666 RepID=A0AAN7R426_TRANT|nr:hypothetical protein SAY86_003155 [Trapa natans]